MSMNPEVCMGAGALTCGECPGFQPLPGEKGKKDPSRKGSSRFEGEVIGSCPMTGGEVCASFSPIMNRTIMELG